MENKIEDDKKIFEFRNILKSIKEKTINSITYKSQNTDSLVKVKENLIKFYTILKPSVIYNESFDSIPIQELKDVFQSTLKYYPRSRYYQTQIEYYLKRDFIDFPFSIDIPKITSYKYDNYEPTHIVENNLSLTEIE
jgi:hypothetical protein